MRSYIESPRRWCVLGAQAGQENQPNHMEDNSRRWRVIETPINIVMKKPKGMTMIIKTNMKILVTFCILYFFLSIK